MKRLYFVVFGGLKELDRQIAKFRQLKVAYELSNAQEKC